MWRQGQLVSIRAKALQVLVLLVERNGGIVSREELFQGVWPDTFVEEANINYTISLLRKSLGNKRFVQTVPKLGYRLVGEIKRIEEDPDEQDSETIVILTQQKNNPRTIPTVESKARIVLTVGGILSLIFLTSFVYSPWQKAKVPEIPATRANIRSLAVLPFTNLGPEEHDLSLSLGLTDSLISRLGSLHRFTIRPFSAVERYTQSNKDSIEFGRELRCDAVLVGTFQLVEGRLHVSSRLLDVRDGTQLWTAMFDESAADTFHLQKTLATQVAMSLLEEFTDSYEELLGKEYTDNPDAYRAYIRGRVIFERRVDNSFQQILDEYQKAISLDPTFALAYTGLADLFSRRGNGLSGDAAVASYKKAKGFARKALELDSDLAEAYSSMGRIKRIADWDWEGAERDFKRSLDLNPNNAIALSWYAQMLSFLGRHDEALELITRAMDIDPISPSVSGVLFPVIEGRGEFDKGLRLAEEAYLFDKQNVNSRRAYATFLYHKGEYKKVIEVAEESMARSKTVDHVWLSLLAASYEKLGQSETSVEFLRQIEEESKVNTKFLYSLAVNYAELGRYNESIDALEKCFLQREERLVWMKNDPRLANLKYDARFQSIMRKMRLI